MNQRVLLVSDANKILEIKFLSSLRGSLNGWWRLRSPGRRSSTGGKRGRSKWCRLCI